MLYNDLLAILLNKELFKLLNLVKYSVLPSLILIFFQKAHYFYQNLLSIARKLYDRKLISLRLSRLNNKSRIKRVELPERRTLDIAMGKEREKPEVQRLSLFPGQPKALKKEGERSRIFLTVKKHKNR